MDEQHRAAVQAVVEQVTQFYKQGKAFRIYHGSTNSTRVLHFDRSSMVDVSALNRVLNIDTDKQVALVEPNVPMDTLVDAALRHGLIPPVVMEFPGITVGGGLQGGAGESSSFKWGTFNNTLNWYDIVLGNGELVRASRHKHSDLFWGAAGSYGSFGIVTAAEVRLVPAKKYVELQYLPVHSFEDATRQTAELIAQDYDYVDGILFSKTSGVLMAGRMIDHASAPVRHFSRAHDEWFYLHAQQIAQSGEPRTEAIPLRDYLFRYDRGAFWMARYAFTRFKTPFNRLTRFLLDPLLHTRPMYEALQASGVSQEFTVQDLALPAKHTVEFLNYVDRELHIYPLWLCPLAVDARSPLHFNRAQTDRVINVGVWGGWNPDHNSLVAANRNLEATVRRLHGRKWLYAYAYYTEKEFWSIYDKLWFDTLRHKYHAEYLPDVYQKTCKHSRQAVSGKRGIFFALLGRSGIRIDKTPAVVPQQRTVPTMRVTELRPAPVSAASEAEQRASSATTHL